MTEAKVRLLRALFLVPDPDLTRIIADVLNEAADAHEACLRELLVRTQAYEDPAGNHWKALSGQEYYDVFVVWRKTLHEKWEATSRAEAAQAEVAALHRQLAGKEVRLAALDQELAGYRNVLRTLHLTAEGLLT